MKESDRFSQPETLAKNLPEETSSTVLHMPEEIVPLRVDARAKIRHRLIGGVILVLTIAGMAPMIFDEAPSIVEESVKVDTKIPNVSKEILGRIEIPVDASNKLSNQESAPADGLGLSQLDKKQDLTKMKPSDAAPQVAPQDVNVNQVSKAKEEGAYFIQVFATSSEAGAMKAMSRFQALGFPVYSVKVQKKSATLWRVRLGHFKTRHEAEEAAEYLDRRKINHLAIQEDKAVAVKPTVAPKPQEMVKKVEVKKESVKTPTKVEPKTAKPVTKSSKATAEKKPVQKAKVETKKSPSVKSEVKTKAEPQKVVKTKTETKSSDPLADTLKAARAQQVTRDPIAEQIARESKK